VQHVALSVLGPRLDLQDATFVSAPHTATTSVAVCSAAFSASSMPACACGAADALRKSRHSKDAGRHVQLKERPHHAGQHEHARQVHAEAAAKCTQPMRIDKVTRKKHALQDSTSTPAWFMLKRQTKVPSGWLASAAAARVRSMSKPLMMHGSERFHRSLMLHDEHNCKYLRSMSKPLTMVVP
jgi:hypothetical protein